VKGRPKKIERTTRWHLRIDEKLSNRVDAFLVSQFTGEIPLRARTELVQSLLGDWVEKKEAGQ
jgi:hypothetical protein